MRPAEQAAGLLARLGVEADGDLASFSPIDGSEIGRVATGDAGKAAALDWRRWRACLRRQTNTINYGSDLPFAQGIKFDPAP